jgi:NTP pyrophosphatase (non-canonical NTP hydrolase)
MQPMLISEFQQFIRERYFATDSARGAPATFLWFTEEVGELAHAIGKHQRGERSSADRANLEEEFADVLAWLTTLANILDVDLTAAIDRKYLHEGGPKGTK